MDTIEDENGNNDAGAVAIEVVHQVSPGGMPSHRLKFKPGMPVILVRNMDIDAGLCNGTRLIMEAIRDSLLKCCIITGTRMGQSVFIPRIGMDSPPTQFPISFRRRQFPIKPAFAMTINKAQGQTLNFVGVCLKDQVFAHGQLYVALSRVGNPANLWVLSPYDNNQNVFHARNVVYPEIVREFRVDYCTGHLNPILRPYKFGEPLRHCHPEEFFSKLPIFQ